jgi:hypothetical protein
MSDKKEQITPLDLLTSMWKMTNAEMDTATLHTIALMPNWNESFGEVTIEDMAILCKLSEIETAVIQGEVEIMKTKSGIEMIKGLTEKYDLDLEGHEFLKAINVFCSLILETVSEEAMRYFHKIRCLSGEMVVVLNDYYDIQEEYRRNIKTHKEKPSSEKQKDHKQNYQPGDTVITRVAGVTFGIRQKIIKTVMSEGEKILVCREPDNIFDKQALAVKKYMHPEDKRKQIFDDPSGVIDSRKRALRSVVIGYVPRELATQIEPIIGKYSDTTFKCLKGEVIEITQLEDKPAGFKIRFKLPDRTSLRREQVEEKLREEIRRSRLDSV